MRTTINIDKGLLKEALKLSNLRTKRELINLSLKKFIRRRHLEKLKKDWESVILTLTFLL